MSTGRLAAGIQPRAGSSQLERYLNSRWRLAYLSAALGCAFWGIRLVVQLFELPSEYGIKAVFSEYMRGATDLNAGRDLYAPYQDQFSSCFCRQIDGYIYPPPFAEALRLLSPLPINVSARIWLLINVLCLAVIAWIVFRLIRDWVSPGTMALLDTGFAFFAPLFQALYYLEVSVLMMLFLAIAARYFVPGRHSERAGLAIAAGVVLKLQPLVMAPMLLRSRAELRRPVGLLAMLAGIIIAGLLSVAITPHMWEYVSVVIPRLMGGTTIPENFSMSAWIARALLLITGQRPGYVSVLTAIPNLAILLTTWRLSWGIDTARGRAAVFASFVAIVPIVSSISWDHHLAVLLLVYALLAPSLSIGRAAWWMTLASYPLVSVTSNVTRPLMQIAGVAHPHGAGPVTAALLLTGLNLCGLLLLWGACMISLRRDGRPESLKADRH